MAGGEAELHEGDDEEDLKSLPPSPTRDVCAAYLLADGRWSSKLGGRVEDFNQVVREGVEIEERHGGR